MSITASKIFQDHLGYTDNGSGTCFISPVRSEPDIEECFVKHSPDIKFEIGKQFIILESQTDLTDLNSFCDNNNYCYIYKDQNDTYSIYSHNTISPIKLDQANKIDMIPEDIHVILLYYKQFQGANNRKKRFIPAKTHSPNNLGESIFAYNMYQIWILRQLLVHESMVTDNKLQTLSIFIYPRLNDLYEFNKELEKVNTNTISPDQAIITLIPSNEFHIQVTTVLKTLYGNQSTKCEQSEIQFGTQKINVFRLYRRWVSLYNSAEAKDHWILLEAIFRYTEELPTIEKIKGSLPTTISEIEKYQWYKKYSKRLTKGTKQTNSTNTKREPIINKELIKICKDWLLQNSDTWNIDFETKGKLLAQWLPTSGRIDSISRTCLNLLADMINKPYFHIWISDDEIKKCMKEFNTSFKSKVANARDVPVFINLDREKPACLKLHFFTGKDLESAAPRTATFNLIKFIEYQTTLKTDPSSFLQLVDVVYRLHQDNGNLRYINATIISNARRNISRNEYSSSTELVERLNKIYESDQEIVKLLKNGLTAEPNEGEDIIEWFKANKNKCRGSDANIARDSQPFIEYNEWDLDHLIWDEILNNLESIHTIRADIFDAITKAEGKDIDQIEDYNVKYYYSRYSKNKAPTIDSKWNKPRIRETRNLLQSFLHDFNDLQKTLGGNGGQVLSIVNDSTQTIRYGNYHMYFRAWLGETNRSIESINYINQCIEELEDIYVNSNDIIIWNKKLRRFMEYYGSDKICRRLVGLFLLHKHNLLCPTGLIQDFNRERIPYQVAKALLLQLCNTASTQPFFIDRVLITPSTTREGELVLLCCKSNNPKRIIKTEFMVEDAIHDQTLQPLTQLLTYIFNNTNGLLPIMTTNFYDGAFFVKYFPNKQVDGYYNQTIMRSLQSPLTFRKKNITTTTTTKTTTTTTTSTTIDYSPLYEGHDERDYTIITFMFHALERQRHEDINLTNNTATAKFFLEFNDLSKKIWKSLQAHEDHSVDTFMNLALCTSGRFIDEIRERYRKTFPHNPIGDDSRLNDLCSDLLSNTNTIVFNQRKPTSDQIKLHNVPREYLEHDKFKKDEENAKQWLLKHFGYAPEDISDLDTKKFEPQVTHIAKPLSVIEIKMNSEITVHKWFTQHIFKPFQNIALTTEFISFFVEALQIFEILQRKYHQKQHDIEPTFIDPLFTNVLEECRNKWLWFIQHYGREGFDGTACQDLKITDISNNVFGYPSQKKLIEKLIRAFGRFDPIHNDKNAIIDNWKITTMDDGGNLFVLIVYWLLTILEEKKLIVNKT